MCSRVKLCYLLSSTFFHQKIELHTPSSFSEVSLIGSLRLQNTSAHTNWITKHFSCLFSHLDPLDRKELAIIHSLGIQLCGIPRPQREPLLITSFMLWHIKPLWSVFNSLVWLQLTEKSGLNDSINYWWI